MKTLFIYLLVLISTISYSQSSNLDSTKLAGIWSLKNSKTNKPYQKWLLSGHGEFFLLKNPNNLDTNTVLRAGFYKVSNDTIKISSWKSDKKHTLLNQYIKTKHVYFLFKTQGDKLILIDPKNNKYYLSRLFKN